MLTQDLANKGYTQARLGSVLLDFTTAITAGGSIKLAPRGVADGQDFLITDIRATFWATTSVSSNIIGTPLPRDVAGIASGNVLPNVHHLRVQLGVANQPWFDEPIPLDLLTGTGDKPSPLLTRPMIGGNENLSCELFNYTNATGASCSVRGCILLMGLKLYKGR